MPSDLAKITGQLVAELETAFCRGRETPQFTTALCSYATHWRVRGASPAQVVDHVQRLIDGVRQDVPELEPGVDEEIDDLAGTILWRCLELANAVE